MQMNTADCPIVPEAFPGWLTINANCQMSDKIHGHCSAILAYT
jgi:hypothetical protein